MTIPDRSRATRRDFLRSTGLLAACAVPGAVPGAVVGEVAEPGSADAALPAQDGGAEPAITTDTIAEAEKLTGIEFTDRERAMILEGMDENLARYAQRRRQVLPNAVAPATVFDPRLEGMAFDERPTAFEPSRSDPGPVPQRDEDLAFAPVTALSQWIERRQLSSRRLTGVYLERLKRIGPSLECVVTLTGDLALRQARRADRELAAGRLRGPLHGIPWGAKDLFDTAGIATTWGAAPYRRRVPESDANVVRRLEDAGAGLVAPQTQGALAYGASWFAGRPKNPWNLKQGSSGSSAGPAAAAVAGLVGFSLGTETLGSIVSPCMRCGATGLRPTFGRVGRSGAMALCWSLDKIGPICRTVEDCALVLAAINGHDRGDPSSIDLPLHFDATRPVAGLRLGYDPAWFEGDGRDLEREVLEVARGAGLELVKIEFPRGPYGALMTILLVEAASAFETLTLTGADDDLVWQDPEAWPNTFRQTRFAPAIEYVQAQRLRREVMEMMAGQFAGVEALISPSYAGRLLLVTNNTGHPSLTIRCGFKPDGTPHGITLWGRLFDEGTLCRIGMALESRLGVWDRRPSL